MAAGSPISNRNAARNISSTQAGPVLQAAAVADSEAADVATIVSDFNDLLAALRTAGVLAE